VPLASRGEAEEHCGRRAAPIAADEQEVRAADGDAFHLTLGDVIVDGQEVDLAVP
jgi:hypothetical protein